MSYRDDRLYGKARKESLNLLLVLSACDKNSFLDIHHLLVISCLTLISGAEFSSLMKRIKNMHN